MDTPKNQVDYAREIERQARFLQGSDILKPLAELLSSLDVTNYSVGQGYVWLQIGARGYVVDLDNGDILSARTNGRPGGRTGINIFGSSMPAYHLELFDKSKNEPRP